MANRRMFSFRIINSAKFLQMPEGSQLLYFHLAMRADDDGIVEAYPVLKLLGTAPDAYRVLLAKGFIVELNSEQVSFVTDWQEHNTIRADRKINSVYLPLLLEKLPDAQVLEPKPRSDVDDNSRRVDCPRTAEVRLGKDKLDQLPAPSAAPKRPSQYREQRHSDDFEAVIDADTGEPIPSPAHTTLPSTLIVRWAEARIKQRFPTFRKQLGCIAKMLDAGYTEAQIKDCWERLEKDSFWSGRGFDFGIVLNEIGKARQETGGPTYTKYENGVMTRYRGGKIISQEKLT